MSLAFFEVIVLALLTFSMYGKFSKNTNFSQPLISTKVCVSEVRNDKFSENLYTHTNGMSLFGKNDPKQM